MPEQPAISDDLRAELSQVVLLGMLERMLGRAATDEDLIPPHLAPPSSPWPRPLLMALRR